MHDHHNVAELARTFSANGANEFEQSIPDRFELIARRQGNALALQTGQISYTYDLLNATANRVAHAIRARRGDRQEPIAVFVEHDAPTVAAILGILKANKICVPVDPASPNDRLAYILQDSQAPLLVASNKTLSSSAKLASRSCRLINLDEIDLTLPAANVNASITPSAISYILYTSGSTGKPKGVVHDHRTVIHNAMRYASGCRISTKDRIAVLASFATGQGTPASLGTLLSGATLYPYNIRDEGIAGLPDWLTREQITVFVSAPTVFRLLAQTLTGTENFPKLRLIRLGSEQIRKTDVDLYRKYFSSNCMLAVFLSSTETGNISQYFINKDTTLSGNIVPAGYPVPDMHVRVIDGTGREVGINEVGEIEVTSRFIALGYWRNPDFTEAAFAAGAPGRDARVYRTGDLGRMRHDGCLEHLGRSDFRVKLRGVRIELEEIESALRQYPAVQEAVVDVRTDASDNTRLVAYVVPAQLCTPTVHELRSYLTEKLPKPMIPSTFMLVDALPLAPTGKVDRRALPAPDQSRPDLDTIYVAPRNPVEVQLATIWEKILGVRPIGVKDNFFDLGGDSLAAVQVIAELESASRMRLSPGMLVQTQTIERLGTAVGTNERPRHPSSLVAIQEQGSRRPFFWVHGDTTAAFLPRYLGSDQPVYELDHQSQNGRPARYTRVETIAEYYLREVATVQSHGPFLLGGYSFGGVVAFEMAQQLQRRGEEVGLLLLLDSPRPPKAESPDSGTPDLPGTQRSLTVWSNRFKRHFAYAAQFGLRDELYKIARQGRAEISWQISSHERLARRSLRNLICRIYVAFGLTLPAHLRSHYILNIYHRALRDYAPKRYPGAAVYIKCEKSSADRMSTWGRLIAGGLQVHTVPGGHWDVLRQGNVHLWAEKLNDCLSSAQAD
jgi:amino acid adenylation domain-containing protein